MSHGQISQVMSNWTKILHDNCQKLPKQKPVIFHQLNYLILLTLFRLVSALIHPVHTVVEKCDCRRFLRQSYFSVTVWTGLTVGCARGRELHPQNTKKLAPTSFTIKGQLANPGLPGKWSLKWFMYTHFCTLPKHHGIAQSGSNVEIIHSPGTRMHILKNIFQN